MRKKIIFICLAGITISVSSAILGITLKTPEKKHKQSLITLTSFSIYESEKSNYGRTIGLKEDFDFEIPPQYVKYMSKIQSEGKRCLFFSYLSERIDGRDFNSNYKLSANPQYGQRSCRN